MIPNCARALAPTLLATLSTRSCSSCRSVRPAKTRYYCWYCYHFLYFYSCNFLCQLPPSGRYRRYRWRYSGGMWWWWCWWFCSHCCHRICRFGYECTLESRCCWWPQLSGFWRRVLRLVTDYLREDIFKRAVAVFVSLDWTERLMTRGLSAIEKNRQC